MVLLLRAKVTLKNHDVVQVLAATANVRVELPSEQCFLSICMAKMVRLAYLITHHRTQQLCENKRSPGNSGVLELSPGELEKSSRGL